MLREQLAQLVSDSVEDLIASGALPSEARGPMEILDTKQPEHGDYACNFAMTASKRAGKNPRELAALLQAQLMASSAGIFTAVEIAGPGFLNLRLRPEAISVQVADLLSQGEDIAKVKAENSLKINVEFVSVNPNGPITVGSGRGAAFGDTLCRVLESGGHEVHREYYINDGVNSEQMRQFADSVKHYYLKSTGVETPFPEKGYRGDYVEAVANDIIEEEGERHGSEDLEWFQEQAQSKMLARQRADLLDFGVRFDTWFSEQTIHDSGDVQSQVEDLIRKGAADEAPERIVLKLAKGGVISEVQKQAQTTQMELEDGGAETEAGSSETVGGKTLWLRSTKFGDDMDRVLRRRDGRLTYIASDVAYHRDKLTDASKTRGKGSVDKLITILGPDHHGYIHRLQAVLAALLEVPVGGGGQDGAGEALENESRLSEIEAQIYKSAAERDACRAALKEAKEKLEVVIFQIVRFVKDGQPAPMRKRDGNIYELRDLINELGESVAPTATKEEQQRVGADVARFFYLMRSHETHMDFDIDLAKKSSDDNPVFYVQYAHARIASVIRKAEEAGITLDDELDTSLLNHPKELSLIKKILDLPSEVRAIAADYGVHRLATFAIELARTYHHFYDACRVIQIDEPALSKARLALCHVTKNALKANLDLLGISAPEMMHRESSPALN